MSTNALSSNVTRRIRARDAPCGPDSRRHRHGHGRPGCRPRVRPRRLPTAAPADHRWAGRRRVRQPVPRRPGASRAVFLALPGNKVLTTASNCFTNLNLTDMETCYKLFRREVIRVIRSEGRTASASSRRSRPKSPGGIAGSTRCPSATRAALTRRGRRSAGRTACRRSGASCGMASPIEEKGLPASRPAAPGTVFLCGAAVPRRRRAIIPSGARPIPSGTYSARIVQVGAEAKAHSPADSLKRSPVQAAARRVFRGGRGPWCADGTNRKRLLTRRSAAVERSS